MWLPSNMIVPKISFFMILSTYINGVSAENSIFTTLNYAEIYNLNTLAGLNQTGFSLELKEAFAVGVRTAIQVCQQAFYWKRWNCSTSAFATRTTSQLTKETAYVNAILAASLVHSITRYCSKGGLINDCGCNELTPDLPDAKDWVWGGCFDNVTFAQRIAKRVLNEPAGDTDLQSTVNRHNLRIGREIFNGRTTRKCKCHGITASCTLKTCWLEVPPLQRMANRIKTFYKKATKFSYDDVNNGAHQTKSKNPLETLAYINKSPNFCKSDNATNVLGTKGRICSRNITNTTTRAEKRSCKNLCISCNYKVKAEKKITIDQCNCTLTHHNGISVHCELCETSGVDYHCH